MQTARTEIIYLVSALEVRISCKPTLPDSFFCFSARAIHASFASLNDFTKSCERIWGTCNPTSNVAHVYRSLKQKIFRTQAWGSLETKFSVCAAPGLETLNLIACVHVLLLCNGRHKRLTAFIILGVRCGVRNHGCARTSTYLLSSRHCIPGIRHKTWSSGMHDDRQVSELWYWNLWIHLVFEMLARRHIFWLREGWDYCQAQIQHSQ